MRKCCELNLNTNVTCYYTANGNYMQVGLGSLLGMCDSGHGLSDVHLGHGDTVIPRAMGMGWA